MYDPIYPVLQTHLINFVVLQAKGEADAELAIMNKLGVIDAVLTKDSDAFPFGAKCVMRVDP